MVWLSLVREITKENITYRNFKILDMDFDKRIKELESVLDMLNESLNICKKEHKLLVKRQISEVNGAVSENMYWQGVKQCQDKALNLGGVTHSTETKPTPYQWLKEEKWKIPKGTTYHDPKVTLTQCANWISEYIKKYCG